ncbi:MAG TPA: hypothetical protein VD931_12255 [Baekduia sp.]|nr:hypothetical protein [Baekduia sp.]
MGTGIRRVAALLGALAGLAATPAAQAADPFFGILSNGHGLPTAKLTEELDGQAATGVGLLREHLHWDRIERSPGSFDWRETDELVARADARGMTILPVLVGTPPFHSTRPSGADTDGWPPRDVATMERFARELARRYGRRGTFWGCVSPGFGCRRPYRPIRAWQVWNEPDLKAWWRTGVDPAGYAELLAAASRGLKRGDRDAEVVLGGISLRGLVRGGFLDQLYDRGAAASFDTLAFHPYAVNVSGVVSTINHARWIASEHGDAGVPIRVTEYGFATGGDREWVTDQKCQAALIAATTRELRARRTELGLRSVVQFSWQDRSNTPATIWPNHAGLLRMDGRPKPALRAFTEAVADRSPAAGARVADVCDPQHQG